MITGAPSGSRRRPASGVDAPQRANYYGATSLVCRSTCGAVNERCAYDSDCCAGYCPSGYCAEPSCAGNSCTAGYAQGGCCSSARYCIHYYSQPTICQATCGQASQHCQANSDCCSNSCTYNSSAGWYICN